MTVLRAWVLPVLLAVAACSTPPPLPPPAPAPPAPPPPQAEPEKATVDAGKACVKAEAACSGGLCVIEVQNACEEPVTCDVGIGSVCKTDAELIDAKARGRDTVPAKMRGKISVAANCTRGAVMTTEVKEMRCR
jgi:hypothetical protein